MGKHYESGNPYGVCDECGLVYRKSELQRRWDGALVCNKDYELRHPQEYIKGIADKIAVKDPRPETFYAIVNDDCSTTDNWTVGVGWNHDSELKKFTHDSGINALILAISGLTNNQEYSIDILAEDYVPLGQVIISCSNGTLSGDTILTSGQNSLTLTSSGITENLIFTPTNSFNGSIKLVAVYNANAEVVL